MRVPFFKRLPVRLAGVILLMGFIAVPLVSELKRRAAERLVLQQAEVQSATATIAVVESLQDILRSVDTASRYLARDLEDRELTAEELDRIIRNVMALNPDFSECSISFEPRALNPAVDRVGLYMGRAGNRLFSRDLAGADYQYWTHDWYAEAVEKEALVWSEPFYDKGGANANVVRVSAPFFRAVNGKRVVAGVVAIGLELGWVKRLTDKNEFFDSGYVIVFSHAGRLITHPNPALVFTETMESLAQKMNNPELAKIHQQVLLKRQGAVSYLSNALHQRVHENYKPVQIGGWGVVVGYDEAEFLHEVSAFRWITSLSLGATLILLSVIVLAVTHLALRPLGRLTEISDEIARGNLDCEIATPRGNDEVGRLTRSFLLMQETLKKNQLLEASVRERTADLGAANEKLSIENLERRWVNQALEHQRRYDQLIVNSISDLVLVLTKALNISRINPAVGHETGWEPQELINSHLSRLVRLAEEAPGEADPLQRALKDGRDLRDRAALMEVKRGRRIPVRLTLFPLRDRDNVVGGIVIIQVVKSLS